ncbi:unnamed protein product [Calicophoron daubneyi]|uniref:Collagen type IV alpha-3-binding protein n=1 Tax=Calicophoron daubneyi TaxID=300641 RepID=A0AAV2TV21_CALDB
MHMVAPPLNSHPGVAISTHSPIIPPVNTIGSTVTVMSNGGGRTNSTKCEPHCKTSQENLSADIPSDVEDISEEEMWAPMPVRGVLSKWTNLLHGWQERYFILSDGLLTYYRSADEIGLGSRGSVRIRTAYVRAHEYDECRFEVRVGELIWYLRGVSAAQRQSWMSAIERHRVAESGYGSEKTLHRPNSLLSLNSTHSPSIASSSSFKRGHRLREKLAEMETFKEILCKQVDSLQAYFDACNSLTERATDERLEEWLRDEDQPSRGSSGSDGQSSSDDQDLAQDAHGSSTLEPSEAMSDSAFIQDRAVTVDGSVAATQSEPIGCISVDEESAMWGDAPLCAGDTNTAVTTPKAQRRVSVAQVISSKPVIVDAEQHSVRGGSGGFFSRFLPFRTGNSGGTGVTNPSPNPSSADIENPVHTNNCQPTSEANFTSSRLDDLRRILKRNGAMAPDFRGEGHMFKATAAGILANLTDTIEMMQQSEEQWRRRFEREVERKRRLEETQRAMAQELAQLRQLIGVNSALCSTTHQANSSISPCYPQLSSSSSISSGQLSQAHSRQASSGGALDLHYTSPEISDPELLRPSGRNNAASASSRALMRLVGPDFQEGPNSPITEEEFYDAIDAESDRMEQDEVRLAALKSAGELLRSAQAMPSSHPLHALVEKAVSERIRNFANPQAFLQLGQKTSHSTSDLSRAGEAMSNTNSSGSDWQVIAQDGDMIIYKRELETEDGVVVDPLQAVHVVPGVTAREMCSYFWDVRYRMDWEFTVDRAPTVLEVCGDDTVVLYQVYKRVWPTTQRDSVFWSHIRQVSTRFPLGALAHPAGTPTEGTKTHYRSLSVDSRTTELKTNGPLSLARFAVLNSMKTGEQAGSDDPEAVLDSWMVVNMSTDYQADKVPPSATPMIRLDLDVVLYCQTVLIPSNGSDVPTPPNGRASSFPRNRLRTRLVYMANVNPGGWVPAAGLRTLARREYPRFLKRFSAYVQEQTHDKDPLF